MDPSGAAVRLCWTPGALQQSLLGFQVGQKHVLFMFMQARRGVLSRNKSHHFHKPLKGGQPHTQILIQIHIYLYLDLDLDLDSDLGVAFVCSSLCCFAFYTYLFICLCTFRFRYTIIMYLVCLLLLSFFPFCYSPITYVF